MLTSVHSWISMKNNALLVFSDALINRTIQEYNDLTVISGASRIHDPVIQDGPEFIQYVFTVSDALTVSMTEQDNQIVSFGCLCKTADPDFLAHCVNGCHLISGIKGGFSCYAEILDQFIHAGSEQPSEARKLHSAGVVMHLTRESFGYLFLIAR